ncbi:MAG: ATP-binding cassette domain-containing protein [Actinomycetota bacterium]|nr:branched-chain amino acid ABC transporter ATP-binding protein/permease [Actinomycetota bacterium]
MKRVFVVGLLLLPLLGRYQSFVFSLAAVYALLALSLVVLTGWSGQLNLHIAALGLGIGAYAAFALERAGAPVAFAVPLVAVVTIPLAVVVAAAAVRFRGLELAVATLAVGLIFERLAFRNIAKALSPNSFSSSYVSFGRPSIAGLELSGDRLFYVFTLVLAGILFAIVVHAGRNATGRTLRAIREREVAAEVLGVPVLAYRIGAFALSMVAAAIAGALFASLKAGITPDSFNLDLSFTILAATVIGGVASPTGAVIAGVLAAGLPELGRSGPLSVLLSGERLFLAFGTGMIIALWRYPNGIAGIFRRRKEPGAGAERRDHAIPVAKSERRTYATSLERSAKPTILRIDDVHVRFGGVTALDGISLFIPEGEICALIGPNGAGKSTLFNAVTGLVRPNAGRIYIGGRDVTEMPAHRRTALGLGRTFQSVEVFRNLTILENVMIGAHLARTAGSIAEAIALPQAARSEKHIRAHALDVLDTLGLADLAGEHPGDLPLGAMRLLEAGMALAHNPALLLLDEPSAGLDRAETERFTDLIGRLRAAYGLTILLVEHDMGVVGAASDYVYALDFGRIIAAGSAAEVRRDPVVIEKYLGAARPPAQRRFAGARR